MEEKINSATDTVQKSNPVHVTRDPVLNTHDNNQENNVPKDKPRTNDVTDKSIKWIGIFALIVSIISCVWSIYTYKKLSPLQGSYVVLSQPEVVPLRNHHLMTGSSIGQNFVNATEIGIVQKLANLGQAPAKKIGFKIYIIPLNDASSSRQIFDDELVDELGPKEEIPFGNVTLNNLPGTDIVIVYHLTYADILSDKNVAYWFRYSVGSQSLYGLLDKERKKIDPKILKRLFIGDNYLLQTLND